ncbi:hypothetical protein [Xylanimonas sp. McL0601]|uniref:hypothetical protein n=1 Tax=Xylanimonas sp. McL0601 TaxID=3414739 RepID=UPI003CF71F44
MSDDTSAGVHRATSGVRPPEASAPRWDPGARYRPSLLARTAADAAAPGAEAGPARFLPGRLFRGPARRTAVLDRDVWAAEPRRPRARSAADLADAVERYRRGALDTAGLVRAVGHALAA